MQELEQLAERSDSLYTGTGGVREEQFPEYHQCALDLLETLVRKGQVLKEAVDGSSIMYRSNK